MLPEQEENVFAAYVTMDLQWVLIQITGTRVGLPPRLVHRIMLRFYRNKNTTEAFVLEQTVCLNLQKAESDV